MNSAPDVFAPRRPSMHLPSAHLLENAALYASAAAELIETRVPYIVSRVTLLTLHAKKGDWQLALEKAAELQSYLDKIGTEEQRLEGGQLVVALRVLVGAR